MKKIRVIALALLIALLLPVFASADVAGIGVVVTFTLLPALLVAAILVTAVVLLIKAVRHRREK